MQEFLFNSFKFGIDSDLSWTLTHNESGISASSASPQLFFSTNENSNLSVTASHSSISVGREKFESINSDADFISCSTRMDGITIEAEYSFPLTSPLFLFRFRYTNNRKETIHCNSINLVGRTEEPNLRFPSINPKYACFVNGWQSWSYSGTYSAEQKQKFPGLTFIEGPLWRNSTTPVPKKKGVFASDFFTVVIDQSIQKGILAGFLSQKQQFGHA